MSLSEDGENEETNKQIPSCKIFAFQYKIHYYTLHGNHVVAYKKLELQTKHFSLKNILRPTFGNYGSRERAEDTIIFEKLFLASWVAYLGLPLGSFWL